MKLSFETLVELLGTDKVDPKKENLVSDCPLCGKADHFGLNFIRENHPWRCFKCQATGSIFKLLKTLDREDLFETQRFVSNKQLLSLFEKTTDEDLEPPIELSLPVGYKRVYSSDYLIRRNFNKESFQNIPVGVTKIERKLRNYVIFPIGGIKNYGYVARSIKKDSKMRYRNSTLAEFSKLLYGVENFSFELETLFLVEGIFGVENISRLLNLFNDSSMEVTCTFGKVSTLSFHQLSNLFLFPNLKNIIILFDNDAVSEPTPLAYQLEYFGYRVKIGYFPESKDSGDVNFYELESILNRLSEKVNFTKVSSL